MEYVSSFFMQSLPLCWCPLSPFSGGGRRNRKLKTTTASEHWGMCYNIKRQKWLKTCRLIDNLYSFLQTHPDRHRETHRADSSDKTLSSLCTRSLLIKRTQPSQTNTDYNGEASLHTVTLLVLHAWGLRVTQCFCAATRDPPCQSM